MSGYGTEPHEVEAVWDAVIGDREVDDDDMRWWTHLSSRLALLDAVTRRVHDERARIAARWWNGGPPDGDSYAVIAARVGLTRPGAQDLVRRGRLSVEGGRSTAP